jgi:hypothetical protein
MKQYSKTALAVLLLAGCAAARERGIACSDHMPGGEKTYQQAADQMFEERDADPDPASQPYIHIFIRASKSYFDSLCTVDLVYGTREASHFMDEHLERLHRIVAVEKVQKGN